MSNNVKGKESKENGKKNINIKRDKKYESGN